MPDELDEELTRAFQGITAPPRLKSAVRMRMRTPPLTRMPELLDTIGWMGILSFAAGVAFFVVVK